MHNFVRRFTLLLAPLALAACTTVAAPPAQSVSSGIVSAADPRAAEAGAAILRQGGTSTDAAIAVMLALTVVEPQSSGIGGGGFYLRGTPDGAVVTLDGRETAPAAAGPDWFLDASGNPRPFPEAVVTGLSIGVPGNIALAAEAHGRYGTLAWADLFAPAIALARNGWEVTPRFREFLVQGANRAGLTAEGRTLFYDTAGEPLAAGSVVRNPALADTLEALAQAGPAGFYRGPMAEQMAEVIAEATPGTPLGHA
ncbi:MAG TPA: gamma-glutamyltransferase, partial [Paracoccaceae bacterium]|nr:gamma-glutamyltransferase [Paracoccaceae bacterium]